MRKMVAPEVLVKPLKSIVFKVQFVFFMNFMGICTGIDNINVNTKFNKFVYYINHFSVCESI